MKHLHAIFLALAVVLAWQHNATADEEPGGGNQIIEGLRDHGVDWLKDKAKDAGEDWIFDTDQSETMHEILIAARLRADGDGNDQTGGCKGAVMGKASSILSDINTVWTVKTAGRLAFDTVAKLAGLAAGGLGAAAEGDAINWLAGQYADAAKGQASDSAFAAIKRAFVNEHDPEFELFETSGTNGPCDYTLRAAWDIVHGSYRVYIAGNCHCAQVGNAGVMPRPLGSWWIAFEGKVRLRVNEEDKTSSWTVLSANLVDFDAQCSCSKRPLRPAFANEQRPTSTPPAGGNTQPPGTAQPPSGTPPPPATNPTPPPGLPPAGRSVCKECQGIQKQIDDDQTALDKAKEDLREAAQSLTFTNARLDADQGKLDSFRRDPSAYDTTEGAIRQQIADDQALITRLNKQIRDGAAEQARLESELRDLGQRLEDCIMSHCPPGHASIGKALRDVLGHVSIGINVSHDPHHHHDDKRKPNGDDGKNTDQPGDNRQPDQDH